MNFNLACAIHAYEGITSSHVTESFRNTGLYPFQPNWAQRFRTQEDEHQDLIAVGRCQMDEGGPASRVGSVRKRRADGETMAEVRRIVHTQQDASLLLQQLSVLIRNAETVNAILMDSGPTGTASMAQSSNGKRPTLDPGAPAECVTLDEVLKRRRLKEAAEVQAELEKQQRKLQRETERLQRAEAEEARRQSQAVERERKKRERELAASRRRVYAEAGRQQGAERAYEKRTVAAEAKAIAREVRDRAAALARAVAAERKVSAAEQGGRGQKRDRSGRMKRLPPLRAYMIAAQLVTEAVMAAERKGMQARVVQH